MRVVGLLFLLSGCLYVGDVNRAPTASLTEMTPPETLIKGATLQLTATMQDPEDPASSLPKVWTVASADGSAVDEHCDYLLHPYDGATSGQPRADVTFYRTGSWVITFQTFDQHHAPSNSPSVMVQVVDAPPTFSELDLKAQESKDLQCDTYVAGQPLTLFYAGTVDDPDATPSIPSSCSASKYDETFRYRWEIVGLPATSHAVLGPKPSKTGKKGDGPCPAMPPDGLAATWVPGDSDYPLAVCVYPDVGGISAGDMYQIVFYASDGTTEISTHTFDAPVRADLPPCLTGAAPTPGAYVVDRSELERFTVTGAADDLDPFNSPGLTFEWSIWREQDPVWRVVPNWTLATYELDTSGFGVGENIRVRVKPADRNGVRTTCDEDLSVCTIDSCLTQMCQAWMTWDLELR